MCIRDRHTTPHHQLTWVSKTKSRKSATGVSNPPDPPNRRDADVDISDHVTRPPNALHPARERAESRDSARASFVSRICVTFSVRFRSGYVPRASHHALFVPPNYAFCPLLPGKMPCLNTPDFPYRRRPRAHRARPQGSPPRRQPPRLGHLRRCSPPRSRFQEELQGDIPQVRGPLPHRQAILRYVQQHRGQGARRRRQDPAEPRQGGSLRVHLSSRLRCTARAGRPPCTNHHEM